MNRTEKYIYKILEFYVPENSRIYYLQIDYSFSNFDTYNDILELFKIHKKITIKRFKGISIAQNGMDYDGKFIVFQIDQTEPKSWKDWFITDE